MTDARPTLRARLARLWHYSHGGYRQVWTCPNEHETVLCAACLRKWP